jgi:AraC-like DNA-binding protein
MTRGAATSFSDRVDAVGVYLHAGYGAELLGVSASVLAGRIVPLAELWGSTGVDLGEAIQYTTTVARRVELLESALLHRLRRSRHDGDRRMMELARAVESGEARPRIAALANFVGLSRQHLTRRFRSALGVTPAVFLRLSRFHRLTRAAALDGGARWAELAASCGYADQSHLIAEWREFTGHTPAALAATGAFHPFMANPHRPRGAARFQSSYPHPASSRTLSPRRLR